MKSHNLKISRRKHRQARIRSKLTGTAQRPRLSVFRSAQHIYAQLIDDSLGKTLLTASSLSVKGRKLKKTEMAKFVGEELGKKALAAGIKKISFDRGGYLYHGRVKALAEGSREKGLEF